MENTYTIDQVRNYVEGWLISNADMQRLSLNEVFAMLNNALVSLKDEQDGIDSFLKRLDWNTFIIEVDANKHYLTQCGGINFFSPDTPKNVKNFYYNFAEDTFNPMVKGETVWQSDYKITKL